MFLMIEIKIIRFLKYTVSLTITKGIWRFRLITSSPLPPLQVEIWGKLSKVGAIEVAMGWNLYKPEKYVVRY